MDTKLKASIWQQFGAAIDMLDDAINLCPDSLWTAVVWDDEDDARYGQFWYLAYHSIVWIDLYLTGKSEGFTPPAPFIRGKLPDNPYSKDVINNYLKQCRQNCKATIETLTDEKAAQICTFDWVEVNFLELQLYSMRHVQEHASQLNMLLGQNGVAGLDWVTIARDNA